MVRLSYLLHLDLQSPDITWNFVVAVIWTNLEGNIAIICCKPSQASKTPAEQTQNKKKYR